MPRHALHSAKLAIEGEREWIGPLPPDLAEFIGRDSALHCPNAAARACQLQSNERPLS
jgi:hypothetical protein